MLSDTYLVFRELALPPADFLVMMLVGGLISLRWRFFGRLIAGVGLAALVLLSMPAVSNYLNRLVIDPPPPLPRPLDPATCQALVVPGGGVEPHAPEWGGHDTISINTLARLRMAVALARESGLPIAVTGGSPMEQDKSEGEMMRQVTEQEFRQPVRWMETHSRTTAENATMTYAMLAPENIHTICLITHAWHMRRAEGAFKAAGFNVVPVPLDLPDDGPVHPADFVPQASAMMVSRSTVRELIGRGFYILTGRIDD